jgi:hypothetical protein
MTHLDASHFQRWCDPDLVQVLTSSRFEGPTFRATGITAYLEAGGTLENAQLMAAHESPRTAKLYDRTGDKITLDDAGDAGGTGKGRSAAGLPQKPAARAVGRGPAVSGCSA